MAQLLIGRGIAQNHDKYIAIVVAKLLLSFTF
ncbi:unnamed protein product [Brugia timori]|uniref:Transposase n=1 Tax=Brugia timori TaxID=42155 RepID=A0A0R3QCK8_9BILA|nr:unnamed protein product [Brugia timori]